MEAAKQGSPEWYAARCGKITASRFADVMTKARSGSGFGQTAQTYMLDLIGERLTGKPAEEIKSKFLDWGNEHEPEARAAYTWYSGAGVVQTGFYAHPDLPDVGGSPDGLVGVDGLVEIKCPYTPKAHVETILSGEVPKQYVWQVQGNLWVTRRDWLDYVSYQPNMPPEMQLYVIHVERDEEMIDELDRKVRQFREVLEARIEKIRAASEQFNRTEG